MADMQKPTNQPPISNQPTPKSGGGAKKFFGFLLVVIVGAAGASMWWHGKQLGEAKAKGEGKPVTEARTIMPWDWTSDQWRGWYGSVENTAGTAADKAEALKQRLIDWKNSRKGPQTVGTTPAGTTPPAPVATTPPAPSATTLPAGTAPAATPAPANTTAPATTPPADAAQAPPEGFEDAAKLVDEGKDAWEKHDYATARTKLTAAQALLKPMADKKSPDVMKALDLCSQLLEDIDMNSPK